MYKAILEGAKFNPQGKSCAIVSNSGELLKNEYGKIIDEHDYIIRCNDAPTSTYESYVGTKTNMMVLSCHFITTIFNKIEEKRLLDFNPNFDKYAITNYKDLDIVLTLNKPSTEMEQFLLDRVARKNRLYTVGHTWPEIHTKTSVYEPSCGFIATLLGLTFFEEVSIFCFPFYKTDKPYYFIDTKPTIQNSLCHSFDKEQKFIQELIDTNMIKHYN